MCLMENHQFWFIKYRWQRSGDKRSDWNHENKLIGEHPLHWLDSTYKKAYLDPKNKNQRAEVFVLDFYTPISAYFFKLYKDVIE